eukprot:1515809-Alexandrium_andersonii.AAC.1
MRCSAATLGLPPTEQSARGSGRPVALVRGGRASPAKPRPWTRRMRASSAPAFSRGAPLSRARTRACAPSTRPSG